MKALDYYRRGLELEKSGWYVNRIRSQLFWIFLDNGFEELSNHYSEELWKLFRDTTGYYNRQMRSGLMFRNYQQVREHAKKSLAVYPMNGRALEYLGSYFLFEDLLDSALIYYKVWENQFGGPKGGELFFSRWFGYVLKQTGNKEEGERYIEVEFRRWMDQKDEGFSFYACMGLAEIYAYRGEKEKAIEQLKSLSRWESLREIHTGFLRSPLFDQIRSDTGFKEVSEELESITRTKHERIQQWVDKNGML